MERKKWWERYGGLFAVVVSILLIFGYVFAAGGRNGELSSLKSSFDTHCTIQQQHEGKVDAQIESIDQRTARMEGKLDLLIQRGGK